MHHIIAAIKSGTDPIVPLPPGAFTRQLEDPIYCPKCDAYYLLIADYEASVNKFFDLAGRGCFRSARVIESWGGLPQDRADTARLRCTHPSTNSSKLNRI